MEFLTLSFFPFLSPLLGYIKASVEFRELTHCMFAICCNNFTHIQWYAHIQWYDPWWPGKFIVLGCSMKVKHPDRNCLSGYYGMSISALFQKHRVITLKIFYLFMYSLVSTPNEGQHKYSATTQNETCSLHYYAVVLFSSDSSM